MAWSYLFEIARDELLYSLGREPTVKEIEKFVEEIVKDKIDETHLDERSE